MEENLRKIEALISQLAEKLAKTEIGSEEYDATLAKMIEANKVRESYAKNLIQRDDNEAKNRIAEAELVVKQSEIKAQKERNWLSAAIAGLYSATSIWTGQKAYKMDQSTLPFKPMEKRSERLMDKIK